MKFPVLRVFFQHRIEFFAVFHRADKEFPRKRKIFFAVGKFKKMVFNQRRKLLFGNFERVQRLHNTLANESAV